MMFSGRFVCVRWRSGRKHRLYTTNAELDFKRAAEYLREAHALVICAGAGIGVDSGLPDFRGNEGFWKAYPPMKQLNLEFSDMANPQWFEKDPELGMPFLVFILF